MTPHTDDPVSKIFNAPDADIVLRSADIAASDDRLCQAEKPMIFLVHASRLHRHSPVFRDMLHLGSSLNASNKESVQLQEGAEVLESLLLLMSDDISEHPHLHEMHVSNLLALYDASIKYGCATIQHITELHIAYLYSARMQNGY